MQQNSTNFHAKAEARMLPLAHDAHAPKSQYTSKSDLLEVVALLLSAQRLHLLVSKHESTT